MQKERDLVTQTCSLLLDLHSLWPGSLSASVSLPVKWAESQRPQRLEIIKRNATEYAPLQLQPGFCVQSLTLVPKGYGLAAWVLLQSPALLPGFHS